MGRWRGCCETPPAGPGQRGGREARKKWPWRQTDRKERNRVTTYRKGGEERRNTLTQGYGNILWGAIQQNWMFPGSVGTSGRSWSSPSALITAPCASLQLAQVWRAKRGQWGHHSPFNAHNCYCTASCSVSLFDYQKMIWWWWYTLCVSIQVCHVSCYY